MAQGTLFCPPEALPEVPVFKGCISDPSRGSITILWCRIQIALKVFTLLSIFC